MRLFLALDLPEPLKRELAVLIEEYRKLNISGAKWVNGEQLHITLQFIGEVMEQNIDAIEEYLTNEIKNVRAFCIDRTQLELIPPNRNPKLLWVNCSANYANLEEFVVKFREFLTNQNIMIDTKPFRMHITLSRFKEAIPYELKEQILNKTLSDNKWRIEEASLYESRLFKEGPQYRKIKTFQLQEE